MNEGMKECYKSVKQRAKRKLFYSALNRNARTTKEEEGATHNLNMQQLLLLHCVELIAFTLDTHVLTHPYHTCTHTHNYTLNKFTQAQIHIYS